MIEKAKRLAAIAEYCVPKGFDYETCGAFWRVSLIMFVILSAVSISIFFLVSMLRRSARARNSRLLWEAHLKQEEYVAPELRLQQVAWKGNDSPATETGQAELTEQIRQALKSRKLNGR